MNAKSLRVTISLLIILVALWMKLEVTKYTVNDVGKYDYVLLTDSIYPIRYQLVLIDNFNRKQYFFVVQDKRISCDEFINSEIHISTEKKPVYGVFVRPSCFRQYNVNPNILIGSGKNEVSIRLLGGGQITELYNPRLFVRAEKFVESFAFTLLKYIYNIFLPIALIVLVFDVVSALKTFFSKKLGVLLHCT